jgi:hypothetical protein
VLPAAFFALLMTVSAEPNQATQTLDRSEVVPDQPLSLAMAKGSTLEIRGGAGEVTVTRAKGDAVVTATRPSGGAEPRIELVKHARGITICSVYDSGNPKKPNECTPMQKGRIVEGVRKTSPPLRFRIEIPDEVNFLSDLAYGDLNVNAGNNNLDLSVFLGHITIADNGSRTIRANIKGSGNIDAVLSAVHTPDALHADFSIPGGELRVMIPKTVAIDYSIDSYNGVETPFKLEKPVRQTRSGHLGPAGRPSIFLNMSGGSLLARVFLLPRSDVK